MQRRVDAGVRVRALEEHDAVLLQSRIEQRCDRGHRDAAQARELARGHADGRVQLERARRVDIERHAHLLEAERVPDAEADGVELLVDRAVLGEAGGEAEEVVDGGPLALGGGRLLRVLERERGVLGDADEHVEALVGRPAAVGRLVDGHDAEHVAAGRAQRHEQRVLGVPAVGVRVRVGLRDVRGQPVLAPVVAAVLDQVRAAALEARVEQRRPVGRGRGLPEQRVAGLRRCPRRRRSGSRPTPAGGG